MNAGELRWQADVLELLEIEPNEFAWRQKIRIWVKVEHQTARSIFSNNTIMQRTVKLMIRAFPELSLYNALLLLSDAGEHCFLTDINKDAPGVYLLTAVIVEPVKCKAERTTTGKGALNRPEVTKHQPLIFPGVLTEKYLRQTQEEPMSVSEAQYVLVTPKAISLDIGELVYINNLPYEIVIPHILDQYKNEYEVLRRSDN